MNVRMVALGLLIVTPAALAQSYQSSSKADANRRTAMLESLQRGKEIKGARDEYRHLPQVFAVTLANASESPELAVSQAEGGAQLLETKGRLALYRSAQAKPAALGRSGSASLYPIVVNTRTGTLGVLTGTLIVKPKNMSDADAIASSYGLVKSKAYAQLQTVFYGAKSGVDLADVSAALQADPRVESAYPEIIERVRVPK